MSFDEESNEQNNESSNEKKPKTFFGMEIGDGVVYAVVIILTLIFIRQISIVFQALN